MTRLTAHQAFRLRFGGKPNFMTPDILWRRTLGRYHVELSRGSDMFGGDLFGVTLLELDGARPEEDVSRCFDSEAQALAYIEEVTGT